MKRSIKGNFLIGITTIAILISALIMASALFVMPALLGCFVHPVWFFLYVVTLPTALCCMGVYAGLRLNHDSEG